MKKLLKLALVVGGIAAVSKAVTMNKSKWQGMTESDVRAKLDAKLPDKVPADKRSEIADKVVGKMREKGVLAEDAPAADVAAPEEPTSD
jgi:hypothetical protein